MVEVFTDQQLDEFRERTAFAIEFMRKAQLERIEAWNKYFAEKDQKIDVPTVTEG